ncbi:kinase-like protein [Xylona heveae TC161]|uniref:Kinase-like protein n=1 Tax=Xylona heveae (strain CBS 132557 / TC161) TaxID=1328760 RepID=A0A165IRK4_XYLHT|nr:kinase-like protein [Xylona heveae TC161]KZF25283.1 kinase-like protein [Xylona heveae TC161]
MSAIPSVFPSKANLEGKKSNGLELLFDELCVYASSNNGGVPCAVGPGFPSGSVHHVRVLEFHDGTNWIVRIPKRVDKRTAARIRSEVHTMTLIRETTNVRVPRVYAYEATGANKIGIPFILMERIPGISAIDARGFFDRGNGIISQEYKLPFLKAIAETQVQISSIRLPKIGTVSKSPNGTYEVGPIPGLGGPFDTASAFFEAQASKIKFPHTEDKIRRLMLNGPVDEVVSSVETFPHNIMALATRLSLFDDGPFPLYHPDFYYSNIILDDQCRVTGIIDWEKSHSIPWELAEFPFLLDMLPGLLGNPCNYDKDGTPREESERRTVEDREMYLTFVKDAEREQSQDARLSSSLGNKSLQDFAFAVRVYQYPGKLAIYNKVLQPFEDSWASRSKHRTEGKQLTREKGPRSRPSGVVREESTLSM